jgi:glycosyltransferase involved in cell wall biosynthesis
VRILVLTFYYPPDLCAGSFRAGPLVQALQREAADETTIDVITSRPNRYRSFSTEAAENERDGTLSILRVPLPPHDSGMIDQSRAFVAYARGVLRATASRRYELVVATSSRLMTAVLGAFVARRTGARLYLDIRDIFADTIREVAPLALAVAAAPVFSSLERWAIESASGVNLVSGGFTEYFESRYPDKRFSFFTNGIDDEFLAESERPPGEHVRSADSRVTVLYAGNIGEGQGLHNILPALAKRLERRVRFEVIGDGGRREALEKALANAGTVNVELMPPLSRRELLERYRRADVLFVHLNDYAAFRKVLPSKIFEYAGIRKPIWAGLAGYPARFVEDEVRNAAVFPPCDVDAAVLAFDRLRIVDTPRTEFTRRYARRAISQSLAADVLSVVR